MSYIISRSARIKRALYTYIYLKLFIEWNQHSNYKQSRKNTCLLIIEKNVTMWMQYKIRWKDKLNYRIGST